MLVTQVPLRVLASAAGGRLSIRAGALVKQRLLAGALALDADAVRRSGAGQLFGRVVESEALDALALGGGVTAIIALIELGFAILVLSLGVEPVALVAAILVTTLVAIAISARYYRARARWTDRRLSMTHDLVERMVGHRTRLAQAAPDRWHDGEDAAVADYVEDSRRMDALGVSLTGLLPRGFLLLGIALLAPAFVSGAAPSGALAVSLGGLVLARSALTRLTSGLADLAGAAIAWKTASPLSSAATRSAEPPAPDTAAAPKADHEAIVDARELTFERPGRTTPVLAGVSLQVRAGDRLLLQGASGSGKSTLGSILSGHLPPATGLLLVGGLDRHTLGSIGLRRRIVAAPQFHDNHVISAPFAFNLLMGRAWPPSREDLALADRICRELQLGPLLDRMPGGLFQMVGETGWQLSHGEKSRLYIARALLQDASLVVLDESFGALDPETLDVAMECVLARAKSVLVIAHP
jgi:ATP-binding cassette subfamily B protein